jgi:alpha-tubulin suppressor-like RCC1 family protein
MLGGIKAISGGGAHTLALDSTGKVWAFGWNFYGQLGDGTNIDRHTPVQVTGLPVVKAIVAAYDFSLAWTSMAVFGPGGTTTSAR